MNLIVTALTSSGVAEVATDGGGVVAEARDGGGVVAGATDGMVVASAEAPVVGAATVVIPAGVTAPA